MRKRTVFTTILSLLTAILMSGMLVCASENEVVFGTDPDDAVKGHIYVRAIVDSENITDVTVELLPTTSEGIMHRYVLTAENGYGIADDIRIGEYDYMSYTAKSGTKAEHNPMRILVTENEPAIVTVIAGSKEFAEKYTCLCSYMTEDGNTISGIITEEEAEEYLEKENAGQPGESSGDEDYYEEEKEEVSGTGETKEEAQTPTPEEENENKGRKKLPVSLFLVPALAVVIAIVWIKRKGGGD